MTYNSSQLLHDILENGYLFTACITIDQCASYGAL